MCYKHSRRLLLIFVIATLVALAGCGDTIGGPGEDADETNALDETPDSDESDDRNETNGSETDESDDRNETNGSETDESDDAGNGSDEGEGSSENETDDGEQDDETNDTAGDNVSEDDARDDEDGASEDGDGASDDGDGEDGDGEDDEGDDGDTEPDASPLTLTVVDTDGEPIEGATVTGQGEPHEADIPLEFGGETDADGLYEDVIYENEYDIDVDHPDYEATTVEYAHDGEGERTVELEPATAQERHEVTFTVLDSETGEPIEGAVVAGKAPMNGSGDDLFVDETGPDGTVTVEGNEGDWWDLEVRADGYETAAPDLGTVDEDAEVTVELAPASALDVGAEVLEHEVAATRSTDVVGAEPIVAND